jgi:hypothetical protein
VDRERIGVRSSNVSWHQYHADRGVLVIGYLNGSMYAYGSVSEAEAVSLLFATSKGTWVWDHIRVRGKGNGRKTRKPFGRL